jgi:hypothetical protein
MRTTIDLPDELFRQVKARAALEGRKLKDLVAEYVAQGLARGTANGNGPPSRRSPVPTFSKASGGGTVPDLSNAEIAEILDDEDAERVRRSAGR